MHLARCHVEFYQARPLPGFARAALSLRGAAYAKEAAVRSRLIDACINAHGGQVAEPRRSRGVANFLSLLRLWRSNVERGAYRAGTDDEHLATLRGYLAHVARYSSDSTRQHVARRWLRRLER